MTKLEWTQVSQSESRVRIRNFILFPSIHFIMKKNKKKPKKKSSSLLRAQSFSLSLYFSSQHIQSSKCVCKRRFVCVSALYTKWLNVSRTAIDESAQEFCMLSENCKDFCIYFHSRGIKTLCTWLFQIEFNKRSFSQQRCEPEHDYIIHFGLELYQEAHIFIVKMHWNFITAWKHLKIDFSSLRKKRTRRHVEMRALQSHKLCLKTSIAWHVMRFITLYTSIWKMSSL